MGFVVYKMLTECLYKIGIWCHQQDKITASDETVMLLMLLTCEKKQLEFFPFVSPKSKHMVKVREECVREEHKRMLIFCNIFMLSFSHLFSYKEVGLFSLEAEIGCNFQGQ